MSRAVMLPADFASQAVRATCRHTNMESGLPPARAVGALLAPVVACLRGDDAAVRVLVADTCDAGTASAVVEAAPAVARVYLRLAPPPDGVERIVGSYAEAALDRFHDPDVVTLGAECLHVARAHVALTPIARAVFVTDALDHGYHCAIEGALASCWWCAYVSAQLRGVDPIEEAAAICRYVARVA
jgi:hypothetical protein